MAGFTFATDTVRLRILSPLRLTTKRDPGLGILTIFQDAVQCSWLNSGCVPCLARELSGCLTITRSPTLVCLPGEPRSKCAFNAFRALSLSARCFSRTALPPQMINVCPPQNCQVLLGTQVRPG